MVVGKKEISVFDLAGSVRSIPLPASVSDGRDALWTVGANGNFYGFGGNKLVSLATEEENQ